MAISKCAYILFAKVGFFCHNVLRKLGGNGLAQENSDDRGGACGDLGADSISSDRAPWVANKSFEMSKFKLKSSKF